MAELAVIVHPNNSATFDQSIIKKLFLGKETNFSDGKVAIPLNANEKLPTYELFNSKVLGKSFTQVNAYWARLVFTGKATMPKILDSDAEIASTVAVNEGAIGYVDSSSVTDKVKVIAKF